MRVGVRDFSLFKRSRDCGRPVYYARFRNEEGSWTAARSTGQTVKALAEGWATAEVRRREEAAAARERERRAGITFGQFAGPTFFDYEGAWALDKRASGKRLSSRQCKEKGRDFARHVLPVLGALKLHEFNRARLKDFRNGMFKGGYSASTINRVLDCIRAVLEAAEDEGRISAVPTIERAAGKSAEKGILTGEELRRLFSVEWEDPRAYYAAALASISGFRVSECLALRLSSIDAGRLLVTVARSFDSAERLENDTTKNGRTRLVTLPAEVCRGLLALAAVNPHDEADPLVFWSDKTPGVPVDYKLIRREFYRAMARAGIDEAERRRRRLGFHGFRGGFNTALLEAHVPPEKIRMVVGHSSAEMTALYYHAQIDALADIRAVQARMLEGVSLADVRQISA